MNSGEIFGIGTDKKVYLVPERKVNSHCYTWAVAINSKRRFKLISRY